MSARLVVLWVPSPATDALVAALDAHPVLSVEHATVDDLAARSGGGRRARLARLVRQRRPRPDAVRCIRLGSGRSGPARRAEELTSWLGRLPRRSRVVALLPTPEGHIETLYHRHVLGGGHEPVEEFTTRRKLLAAAAADRVATAGLLDATPTGRLVVADGSDADLDRLAAAAGLARHQLPATRPAPQSPELSARGLEILRRLNAFAETPREHRTMARFARTHFTADEDEGPEVLDESQRARVRAALER